MDADSELRSLCQMLSGRGSGGADFAGMFRQKYGPLPWITPLRESDKPSTVGMYYAVVLTEVTTL